jgi:hypothetical protein
MVKMIEPKLTYVTKHVCDECWGTGSNFKNCDPGFYINPSPCPKCGGTGEIMEPVKEIDTPINPGMQEAFSETARLLREALQVASPFTSSNGTITVDYAQWDMMNIVLDAIREKLIEWDNLAPMSLVSAISLFDEISDLLKKAGH